MTYRLVYADLFGFISHAFGVSRVHKKQKPRNIYEALLPFHNT